MAEPHGRTSHPLNNWIDQFHLAIIAKENLDIDNLKEPVEGETTLSILEGAQESEIDQQRKAGEARNKEVMRVYEHAEEKRLAEEKRKFGGMRRYEADKKVRSNLYLALGAEGKRVFTQKHPKVKILGISFKKFYELLESVFIKPTNSMKYGTAFTKGHLNVCPAKEIVCNICKYKGHFGRLCKSKGRKPAVNTVDEAVNRQNCSYSPEDLEARS